MVTQTDNDGVKSLLLDIETFSNKAYVWGLWGQDIGLSQLIETSRMICWGASWKGSDETIFSSEHLTSRKKMLKELHLLMSEADEIVSFNGTKFDIPIINKEFLLQGMGPPSPFQNVDLLRTVRRNFRFTSNKLDHIVQQLGIGAKMETGGFDLWTRCNEGDDEAWDLMEEYNLRDVILMDELYDILRPWANNLVNRSVFQQDLVCDVCGSHNYKKDGFKYTRAGKYQAYQCKACGHYFRGNKTLARTEKFVSC